jgi:hypothetical protein
MHHRRRTLINPSWNSFWGRVCAWAILVKLVSWAAAGQGTVPEVIVLQEQNIHLGKATPEWAEYAGRPVHTGELSFRFSAAVNSQDQVLLIEQKGVKYNWSVRANGKSLGALELMETPTTHTLRVPRGTWVAGENTVSILPPSQTDDIEIGEVKLYASDRTNMFAGCELRISVYDQESRVAMPCRLTLVTARGFLAPLRLLDRSGSNAVMVAERTGVIYSGNGRARVGLLPGDYTVYASRGFEYGVVTQAVTLRPGDAQSLRMTLLRQVRTEGWVSADTHIHTLTHSGHGDATMDERVVTIAGEGIELAVATDHNHHTDYHPTAVKNRVASFFASVVGNEVTTTVGHFNAFPVHPDTPPPDHRLTEWSTLLRAMRNLPGVQVITLNHPRDKHSNFVPLNSTNFNEVSGESPRQESFDFDGLEVVTSAAMQSDIMLLFSDWFALLNRGHRIAALASSDTHEVNRFILGQARTYIWCPRDHPPDLDLKVIWESFRRSRLLVSMGLLTTMEVGGKFGVGDLATGFPSSAQVHVQVRGPAWTAADRLELFVNGIKVRAERLNPTAAPQKAEFRWPLPPLARDYHLIAIATGPGVTAPYWEFPRSYQPSSPVHNPRVLGATNPIWVDADGDGKFTSAYEYARELTARTPDLKGLLAALAAYDESVAVQAASLVHARGLNLEPAYVAGLVSRAAPQVKAGWHRFQQSLPR